MKVIVVGGGAAGLATAWALQRGGAEVTVFEQAAEIPNPLGSSVDDHRLIRYPYGAALGYTRMVAEAYGAWETLWGDLGQRLAVETGTLAVSTNGERWVADSAATLAAAGQTVERLDIGTIAKRWPLLNADAVEDALYLPSGGVLFARAIVAALARHLIRSGTAIRTGCAVRDVLSERAEVVLADGRREGADALVVAAGPWTSRLLPEMASRVTPSRQIVVYLQPPASLQASWATAPMILDIAAETGFYAVPPVTTAGVGPTGLKIGDHRFSLTGDPDRDRAAQRHEVEDLLASASRRLARFERYEVLHLKTCFYTVEPQERFVVEPLGPAAWVISACSGHGFKFTALLGLRLAAALRGEQAAALPAWAAGLAA